MIDILLDPLVWVASSLLITMLFSLFKRRCLRCLITSLMTLCLLVAISSPAFSNRWLATLEDAYPLRHCDVESSTRPVVVLGGGMSGGYSSFAAQQRLSDASKNRALAAAEIVKPGGILFIAGGKARNRRTDSEADAMGDLIAPVLAEGVTVAKEVDSESTYQNALNLAPMFDQMELPKDIVLVTSAWHMSRAVGVFRKRGFEVCTYGVDPLQHIGVPLTTLWPQVSALNKTKIAIHEWVGWYFYRRQDFI